MCIFNRNPKKIGGEMMVRAMNFEIPCALSGLMSYLYSGADEGTWARPTATIPPHLAEAWSSEISSVVSPPLIGLVPFLDDEGDREKAGKGAWRKVSALEKRRRESEA